MPDYLPRREGARVAFARQLAGALVHSPGDYGVSALEAEAYRALWEQTAQAWRVSQTPMTRTAGTVQTKDQMLAELVKQTREVVARIRGYLSTAEHAAGQGELLTRVGLKVTSRSRRVLRVPGRLPVVSVLPRVDGQVEVRVTDPAHPERRARPRGVRSLMVMCRVQSAGTGQWSGWRFEGASGRMRFKLAYPRGAAAGDRLQVSVRWSSPSGVMGPGSVPGEVVLPPKYAMRAGEASGRRAA